MRKRLIKSHWNTYYGMNLAHENEKVITGTKDAKDGSRNIYYEMTCAHEGNKWNDEEEKDEQMRVESYIRISTLAMRGRN